MKTEHVTIAEVVVHGQAGSSFGNCVREAIVLAATEWRNVKLIHQGNVYDVRPNALIAAVEQHKDESEDESDTQGDTTDADSDS